MKEIYKTFNLIVGSKIRTGILFILVILLILAPFSFTGAASLSDLQKQKAGISKTISDKTKQAQQKQAEIDQYNKEVAQLDNDIDEIQRKINDTNKRITDTTNGINDKIAKIDQETKELEIEKSNQDEAIRTIYESGDQNTFEIIVGSNTLSDLIDHSQYLESLENSIEETIVRINKIKADLENQKVELEKQKKDLTQLQQQQQAYRYGLNSQKDQKNKLTADAKSQQKSLDQQIADAKKMGSQVDAQISAVISANNGNGRTVIARDRGTSAVGFQWPMDYKYISTYFGGSTPFQSFHTGIDLVNVLGSPIYAASNGTVIATNDMMSGGYYYGYGKYIIIGHNAKYSSLYGHLMGFAVSVGDEVKKGDIIGYEGSTGWSTGPHMHFEIRENNSPVNPIDFLP